MTNKIRNASLIVNFAKVVQTIMHKKSLSEDQKDFFKPLRLYQLVIQIKNGSIKHLTGIGFS